MNEKEIEQLMTKFDQSSLLDFQLVQDEFQLSLSKREQATPSAPVASVPTNDSATVSTAAEGPAQAVVDETATAVKAPLVGVVTFNDPAKQVGDPIQKGDVICSIEAMKMANEVKSPVTGTIKAVLVDDQTMVEYDQPLFEISEG